MCYPDQMEYLDFELEVGPGSGGRYRIAVLRSPAGETSAEMAFPFGELELQNRLQALQIALLRGGSTRRRVLAPEAEQVQAFGRELFQALFGGQVGARYLISQREALRQGKGLRLKLRIQPPELATLPWEFLYDPQEAEYVVLSRMTPVVRYLEVPQAVEPLLVTPPLRVLGMVASPGDLPALDVAREKQRIEMALAAARAEGRVAVTWMEGASWRDLQRAMRQGPWHVFHFVGHGGFDRTADEGFVALVHSNGETDRFNATRLGRMLSDHHWLRLVVLNACEGATGSQQDIFSSTAATLVRRGIPAVLAMQYEITDRAAIEMARTFYELLAEGAAVDDALAETRKAISFRAANSFEWGTPVLFMRAPDGVLFEVAKPDTAPAGGQGSAPARRAGIPSALYLRLQRLLGQSEAFSGDGALRALFVDRRLTPWRTQLPQADSVGSRVQKVVDYLYQREAENGENALVQLLRVLQDQVDPGDARHRALRELADEIAASAGDGKRPPVRKPVSEERGERESKPQGEANAAWRGADESSAVAAPEQQEDAELAADAQAEARGAEKARRRPVRSVAPALLHVFEGYGSQVWSVAFSPDGSILATGSGGTFFSGDKAIRLWRMPEGALLRRLEGHTQLVRRVTFAPDGALLASAANDGTVCLWQVPGGKPLLTLAAEAGWVGTAAFSPDGTLLASAGNDYTVRLSQLPTGKPLRELEGHAAWVQAVAFSPEGTVLASASMDKTIRLWQVPDGRHLRTLEGHTGGLQTLAFSPDGTYLASGGYDSPVRLWQLPGGEPLSALEGHEGSVNAVAVSPDGALLASAGADNTVRLWRMADGSLLHTLKEHKGSFLSAVNAVAFSPDGTLLASGGDDKTVRLWELHFV